MFVNNIEHRYEDFCLDIKNIEFKNNSVIGLVGENGGGKTTLMNILSGEMIANGRCSVKEDLVASDRIMIYSDLEVYDYLTVEEFLGFVIKYNETQKDVEELLEILGLSDKRKSLIEELSLGMKKKLTLTPLFVREYDYIFLDEPFNSIDLNYIYRLKELMKI